MAVQFSCRFAEHESFGVISGSWILLYRMSVHLSTAPSAAAPLGRLTNWSALNGGGDVSCPESEFTCSESVSLCKELCRSEERGLKACLRGWNWIVVSLYVRGSGCWCQYRYLVDSCLGNRRRRRKRTGISVGSFLAVCRLTDNEGNFHKCHQYIIVCVQRHHHSHSADVFRPRVAIVQYSNPSGITCIAFHTTQNVFSDTRF